MSRIPSPTSPPPDPRPPRTLRRWLDHAPFLVGAILFHLIALLMVATFVIFKAPAPPPDDTSFTRVKIAPPPPPPAPPAAAGGQAQNAMEPDLTTTPPPTTVALSVTTAPSTFNVTTAKVPMPSFASLTPPKGTGLQSTGATGSGLGATSAFGSQIGSGNGFAGTFYDLKQTPGHQPTNMDADKEQTVLRDFFSHDWNEGDWATKYLKGPTPLYANELLVPLMLSSEGPRAYGLGKVCGPGYWCALYHLKINPAHSGNYRVAGYGDDFLVVRIDGHVVLDSGWYPPVTGFKREKIYPPNWLKTRADGHPEYGQTVVGTSFHMDIGEPMTIDVLLGDAVPGSATGWGRCGFFLFLLQDGKDYDQDAQGNPLLPVLQVQPNSTLDRPGEHPPYTTHAEDSLLGS